MSEIYICLHLGLGDAIVCNGLIREIKKKYDKVVIPCYAHNLSSVKYMFDDEPEIRVHRVYSDSHARQIADMWEKDGRKTLRIGLHRNGNLPFDFDNWDIEFYSQSGIPFEKRWTSFYVPYNDGFQIQPIQYPYAFVHEDPRRGYLLDQKRIPSIGIVRPYLTSTIFDWQLSIQKAEEIHCIDSSFLCFTDSISDNAKIRAVHRYARKSVPPKLKKEWRVLYT